MGQNILCTATTSLVITYMSVLFASCFIQMSRIPKQIPEEGEEAEEIMQTTGLQGNPEMVTEDKSTLKV